MADGPGPDDELKGAAGKAPKGGKAPKPVPGRKRGDAGRSAKPGAKPKGKAGRASAGSAARPDPADHAAPTDRPIPAGPGPRSTSGRGASGRDAPDRGVPDSGPWRPSTRPGGPGQRRGQWRPPTSPGGRPDRRTDRRPVDRPPDGPPGPPSHDRGRPPYQGGRPPRPFQPTGRPPGPRPPYGDAPARDRGGPPPHRDAPQPYRGGPPSRGGPPPYRGDPSRDRGRAPDRPPWRPDRPGGPPADRGWQRPGPGPTPWPRPADSLPAPDLLGPDEELVAGRRPVEEVFAAGRTALRLLVVPQRRNALEQLVLHATRLRIPIVEVEGGSLTAIAGFDGHQGVALVVEPRQFATLADILARARERGEPPFVLVLDSLEDPQNVGTLLRSAEAAGVHGIVFPTRRQAPLSPAAVKASAGAVEHLLLAPVDDLAGALADLHAKGLRVAGSEADAPLTARQTDLRGPLAIVIGSEGQGLGPSVRKRCDLFMRIPMRGSIGSLNAAVAGSILLFEAVAQRDPAGRPDPHGVVTEVGETEEATEPPATKGAQAAKTSLSPTKPKTKKAAEPAAEAAAPDVPADTPDADLLPGGPPPHHEPGPDEPPTP
jgi:23S rRNA (guanosine2251-2'-O)-methyltransferase